MNVDRYSKIDTSTFKLGQTILFCYHCDWQSKERQAMVNQCPSCGRKNDIRFIKVDDELLELIENNKGRSM